VEHPHPGAVILLNLGTKSHLSEIRAELYEIPNPAFREWNITKIKFIKHGD
jgi:hypothetical protein